jgi:hypothetical protein
VIQPNELINRFFWRGGVTEEKFGPPLIEEVSFAADGQLSPPSRD